jgi:hypothetical protein
MGSHWLRLVSWTGIRSTLISGMPDAKRIMAV